MMYHRLYHRSMPREDSLSSRFDYLFEPLDVEESVSDSDPAGRAADDIDGRLRSSGNAAPVRLAFAAFILATLGAVAVVAVLLLQQPAQPHSPADPRVEPVPLATTAADIPIPVATVPPPPPPTTVDDRAPQTIEPVPTHQVVSTPPQPAQTPAPPGPRGGTTKSPATRSPMSVAPEPRAPFPNQAPRTAGSGGGGLLGGLL